jgi:hypothetical protein
VGPKMILLEGFCIPVSETGLPPLTVHQHVGLIL